MSRNEQLAARRAFETEGYELRLSRPDIGIEVYAQPSRLEGAAMIFGRGFTGRAGKPAWSYAFRNEADLDKYVAAFVASAERSAAHKAKIKAERKAGPGVTVRVGDVFSCSWGYDQTNVDYYQVTRVISDKTVEICKIAAVSWEEGHMQGRSVPSLDSFIGAPMVKRMRATGLDGGAAVKIASYADAYLMKPFIEGVPAYASTHWTAYA